jgi:hypothetical protein
MFLDEKYLKENPEKVEEIEKSTLRMVVQAIYDYRSKAQEIFEKEVDLASDIGEDITREALERLGMHRIDQRLFGRIDYKCACYLFHPDYAVRQALFVDSKAEEGGSQTATLQMSQISMRVRQRRSGKSIDISGEIEPLIKINDNHYLTTTVFVKYNYRGVQSRKELTSILVTAVPNGILQDTYNPDDNDTIWLAGRDAPTRKEKFRVRLSFDRLKKKAAWRVQVIPMPPDDFHWNA